MDGREKIENEGWMEEVGFFVESCIKALSVSVAGLIRELTFLWKVKEAILICGYVERIIEIYLNKYSSVSAKLPPV